MPRPNSSSPASPRSSAKSTPSANQIVTQQRAFLSNGGDYNHVDGDQEQPLEEQFAWAIQTREDQDLSETFEQPAISNAMAQGWNVQQPMQPSETSNSDLWTANVDETGVESETPYRNLSIFESVDELLDQDDHEIDSATLFDSLQESCNWRDMQMVPEEAQPEYDETIPRTLIHKKACVKLLFKAWKSIGAAEDNEGMIKPFEQERHDNARVECLCWMLLEALIRRCEKGPLLIAYDPVKSKDTPGLPTFAERFDEVVTSLAQQKTICKHLFDAPYINTFVDDPVRSRSRVASNRQLNKKKGTIMAEGKKGLNMDSKTRRAKKRKRTKRSPSSSSSEKEMSDEEQAISYSASPATPRSLLGRSAQKSHARTSAGGKVTERPSNDTRSSKGTPPARFTHSSQYLAQYARTPSSMGNGYDTSAQRNSSSFATNGRTPTMSFPESPSLGRGLKVDGNTTPSPSSESNTQSLSPHLQLLPEAYIPGFTDAAAYSKMGIPQPTSTTFSQIGSHVSIV